MSQKFHGIKVPLDQDIDEAIREYVQRVCPQNTGYIILKQSIDARRRHDVHRVLSVEVFGPSESPSRPPIVVEKVAKKSDPVVVVGSGPGGLFAALRLLESGVDCILLERGSVAEKRLIAINRYWRYGELHPEDNVCFGEGGAGLYSDGKLMTRIKSEYIPYVLRRLVEFGAPPEIEYSANPHVGSDRIRRLIPIIRKRILELGGIIHFNTKLIDFEMNTEGHLKSAIAMKGEHRMEIECRQMILATGHSAKDVYAMLGKNQVKLEGKSFAIGLRIEHPQSFINSSQYRQHAKHPTLGAANYKLTYHDEATDAGVYSFCMCPGGIILASGTEADGIVCNGMSNYLRNSGFANAGIVVSLDYEKHFGSSHAAGLDFQYQLEKSFHLARLRAGGKKEVPVQGVLDFLNAKPTRSPQKSSTPSGVIPVRIDQILPSFISEPLKRGLIHFEEKIGGFSQGQLHAVESRTSSPVRISRDPESLQSLSHPGLYPVGEGAGYAGGITSAAVDGIRSAEKIKEALGPDRK